MEYGDALLKLGLSAVLGFIIGLERELRRKPLGLKTCLVISIISCLLTIVSIQAAYTLPKPDHITMDPMRLTAQIISGIGFLGGGVILRRGNESIAGLTTAAMIWGAAGLGIAVGAGFYMESILGMVFLIISVEIIPLVTALFGPKRLRRRDIGLKLVVNDIQNIPVVLTEIRAMDIQLNNMKLKMLDTGEHFVQMRLSVNQKLRTADVYYELQKIRNVRGMEIESF
ncbi:MgtC/SapB family protein [Ectobacillus ponti]|uniref:MgtC/SapB family protein n=1 Tax=Ectobacillus ponti TaxID=2961894 RepID=A0AA41X6G3_9BACI|nr:MgtC/SapB family protein [Ectobacillus ponti]MCP8969824.1 MgtC/SapB family protein [Ectobacillus ponti]